MGRSPTAAEVTDAVIGRENLPEETLEKANMNDQSKVKSQIAWTHMYPVHSGHIDSSLRSLWRLTDKGQHEDLNTLDVALLFKGVQSSVKGPQDDGSPLKNSASVEATEFRLEAEESALLPVIKALSAEGF
jgi:restriction endonuclease Mrr